MTDLRNRGTMSNDQYLTAILLALVAQAGELHIDAKMLESIDLNATLVTDWDVQQQQLVIRSLSSVQCFKASGAWQQNRPIPLPASQPNLIPNQNSSNSSPMHSVMTDERAQALIEQRETEKRMKQYRDQTASVLSEMPDAYSMPSRTNSQG